LNLPLLVSLAVILVGIVGFGVAWNAAHPRVGVRAEPARPAGILTGAFMDFGDNEDDVTLEKIEAFEGLVGKHQAIIASSSYWGEQTFPAANMRLIARHGSIPLVFWSPWDRPYKEGRGPDKYSLTSIIAGAHDAYIDSWADGARDFGGTMIVSFANEMNGSWFPWSGVLYGGDKPAPGGGFQGPETFKAAWRHVVDRVRARGATNVKWVLHLMDFSMPYEEWNLADEYYPGADYVDWLGFSLYGAQFPADDRYPDFFSCFDWPYTELTEVDPTKPIMLCEWGVGEFPAIGDKGEWIRGAFRTMSNTAKYPRLQAAVYWNERWQNSANEADESSNENAGKYSDLRVNSSPGALRAYREGVASPLFLDRAR
jgi:beta-mannanase